ncbi:MAG: hypothetical protein K0R63_1159 [Rickettsiales bacterium]|nr:hypothetical protein [Rickettsiales bacterium]
MPRKDIYLDFQILKVPHLHRIKGDAKAYRVYKDATTFETVEADTSQEAIEKSGIAQPYRVWHENLRMESIIEAPSLNRDGEGEFPIPHSIQEVLEKRKKIAGEEGATDTDPTHVPPVAETTPVAEATPPATEATSVEVKEETPAPAPDAIPETGV